MEEDKELDEAVRKAAALLLAERYRTTGVPAQLIEGILRKSGKDLEVALEELKRRLEAVGVVVKKVKSAHGSRVHEKYIAVIDPRIDLPELRPFDPETMGVLALIFLKARTGSAPTSSILNDLKAIVGDEEVAKKLFTSAVKRLSEKGIIKIDASRGVIELTELGMALMPPSELIDNIMLEAIAGEE